MTERPATSRELARLGIADITPETESLLSTVSVYEGSNGSQINFLDDDGERCSCVPNMKNPRKDGRKEVILSKQGQRYQMFFDVSRGYPDIHESALGDERAMLALRKVPKAVIRWAADRAK